MKKNGGRMKTPLNNFMRTREEKERIINALTTEMWKKLDENDHKGSPIVSHDYAYVRFRQEFNEFIEAYIEGDINKIIRELADVGNFAGMLTEALNRVKSMGYLNVKDFENAGGML